MSEYFKATGFPADDFMSSMKNYKIHACFKHSTLHTKEWFEGEIVENKMTLDVEGPMRFPDDKQGNTTRVTKFAFTRDECFTSLHYLLFLKLSPKSLVHLV